MDQLIDDEPTAAFADNVDIHCLEFLLAARKHDIAALQHQHHQDPDLIFTHDSDSRSTALHEAILGCTDDQSNDSSSRDGDVNEDVNARQATNNQAAAAALLEGATDKSSKAVMRDEESINQTSISITDANPVNVTDDTIPTNIMATPPPSANVLSRAKEIVVFLLSKGSCWDALDEDDETPGCIALRLGFTEIYSAIVSAGVEQEQQKHSRLQYVRLSDSEGEREDGNSAATNEIAGSLGPDASTNVTMVAPHHLDCTLGFNLQAQEAIATQHSWLARIIEVTNKQLLAELSAGPKDRGLHVLVFGRVDHQSSRAILKAFHDNLYYHTGFLSGTGQTLHLFTPSPDPSSPLPDLPFHATAATPKSLPISTSTLNTAIIPEFSLQQSTSSVLADTIRVSAIGSSPLPSAIHHTASYHNAFSDLQAADAELKFDRIFFDTAYFGTGESAHVEFREVVDLCLLQWLAYGGCWGFFNSIGADRQVSHDVYQRILNKELHDSGWEVEWVEISAQGNKKSGGSQAEGRTNADGKLRSIHMPICK